jgi:hypothetical protein
MGDKTPVAGKVSVDYTTEIRDVKNDGQDLKVNVVDRFTIITQSSVGDANEANLSNKTKQFLDYVKALPEGQRNKILDQLNNILCKEPDCKDVITSFDKKYDISNHINLTRAINDKYKGSSMAWEDFAEDLNNRLVAKLDKEKGEVNPMKSFSLNRDADHLRNSMKYETYQVMLNPQSGQLEYLHQVNGRDVGQKVNDIPTQDFVKLKDVQEKVGKGSVEYLNGEYKPTNPNAIAFALENTEDYLKTMNKALGLYSNKQILPKDPGLEAQVSELMGKAAISGLHVLGSSIGVVGRE